MKLFVQSCDAGGDVNPIIRKTLLDYLPMTDSIAQADAVVVPVCFVNNFRFQVDLYRIKKPIVILDFLEFGWDADQKPNMLGTGSLRQFGHLASDEWDRLDTWAKSHSAVLTFKRELHSRDKRDNVLPIEFPYHLPIPEVQTREQFDARPLEVFSAWGLSHPTRQALHGDIFRQSHREGINVIDAWDQDGHFESRNWATIHVPHYNRKSLAEVMRWNERAKISVSLPGAGVKCFRSAEAPVGSIMALHYDTMEWTYPWTHGENCIQMTPDFEVSTLLAATRFPRVPSLYDIYRASQETIAKYQSARYAREHVLAQIEARL